MKVDLFLAPFFPLLHGMLVIVDRVLALFFPLLHGMLVIVDRVLGFRHAVDDE